MSSPVENVGERKYERDRCSRLLRDLTLTERTTNTYVLDPHTV